MFIAIVGIVSVGNDGNAGRLKLGMGILGGKGIPGILNEKGGNFGRGIFILIVGMFIFGKLNVGISGKAGSLNGNVISGNLGGKEKGMFMGIDLFNFTLKITF